MATHKTATRKKATSPASPIFNKDVRAEVTTNLFLQQMIQNKYLTRANLFQHLLDGSNRDLDEECGYPSEISADQYHKMYQREGVAKRVVNCVPEESWAMDPMIYETEDSKETEFEVAWKDLATKLNLFHFLERLDELSGVGRFGILLIGLNDGLELSQPVEGIDERGEKVGDAEHEVIYLRVFDESAVTVTARETDRSNPRFGQPITYNVSFQDSHSVGQGTVEITTSSVHWTRVIHAADGRQMSEVYGTPRMEPVYNRLLDVRKIASSSPEMFWKGAFPGFAFEVNPDLADTGAAAEMDVESIREEMANYANGLQRFFAVTGVTAKSLTPQVSDPSPHVEIQLKLIAITMNIPFRILFGSEQAQLASSQDAKSWARRMQKRQEKYITPLLLSPVIDRFIALGVVPEPTEYHVDWPDLASPSDMDQAQVAVITTDALTKYVQGGVDQLIPPQLYLTEILKMTTEEADAIIEGAKEYQETLQEEADAEAAARAALGVEGTPGVPGLPQDPSAVPPGSGNPPATNEDAGDAGGGSPPADTPPTAPKIRDADGKYSTPDNITATDDVEAAAQQAYERTWKASIGKLSTSAIKRSLEKVVKSHSRMPTAAEALRERLLRAELAKREKK